MHITQTKSYIMNECYIFLNVKVLQYFLDTLYTFP